MSPRMAELCAAASLFTDLGTGQPRDHALRTCIVATRLGEHLDVGHDERRAVYYTSLLRFIGCSADAHEIAASAGGDEITLFGRAAPVVMGSTREELLRTLGAVGVGQPLHRRARLIAAMLADPNGRERLLDAHCEVAAHLASDMGLPSSVVDSLAAAYARWDGRGVPPGVAGEEIPLPTRVTVVARDLEIWARDTDADTAATVLRDRRGAAYDPTIVDAALEAGIERLRQVDGDPWDLVLDLEPEPHERADGSRADATLAALGDFADLKAPEFSGHSRRVRHLVATAAAACGLARSDAELVSAAATVHDLGVVAVPGGLWAAPRRLTVDEAETVQLHALWTSRLLRRAPGLADLARLAGSSHERLDGSGYPAGTPGDPTPGWALLAAADHLDEHCSPRPYRPAASIDEVAGQLATMVGDRKLPHEEVAAVVHAAGQRMPTVELARPAGLTEREVDVLALLARGGTNVQIAASLGISPKTVGTHVEHIYAKAGVRSRAAATLFAMQHDLVGPT